MEYNKDGLTIHLTRLGLSKRTIGNYQRISPKLFNNLDTFSKQAVETCILRFLENGTSKRSLNSYVSLIRHYADFVGDNQLSKMPYFRWDGAMKVSLSDSEIKSFLGMEMTRKCPKDVWGMYNVMFAILSFSGMRTHEVADLTKERVDFATNNFILLHTKTKTPRLVPIHPILLSQYKLKEYVQGLKTNELFVTSKGKPMSDHAWSHAFKTRIERLGISRPHLTPYSLRHSFIIRAVEQDTNLFRIQQVVGHKDINSTAQYVRLPNKTAQDTVRKDRLGRSSISPKDKLKAFIEYVSSYNLEDDPDFKYKITTKDNGFSLEATLK